MIDRCIISQVHCAGLVTLELKTAATVTAAVSGIRWLLAEERAEKQRRGTGWLHRAAADAKASATVAALKSTMLAAAVSRKTASR